MKSMTIRELEAAWAKGPQCICQMISRDPFDCPHHGHMFESRKPKP